MKHVIHRLISKKKKYTNRENEDRVWVKIIKLKLKHSTLDNKVFYCVEDTLLFILYIENRIWLIILHLVFVEGTGNCNNGSVFSSWS